MTKIIVQSKLEISKTGTKTDHGSRKIRKTLCTSHYRTYTLIMILVSRLYLKLTMQEGERLKTKKIEQENSHTWIMRPVVEAVLIWRFNISRGKNRIFYRQPHIWIPMMTSKSWAFRSTVTSRQLKYENRYRLKNTLEYQDLRNFGISPQTPTHKHRGNVTKMNAT